MANEELRQWMVDFRDVAGNAEPRYIYVIYIWSKARAFLSISKA